MILIRHIFSEAIKNYLGDKLVLLITNNLQFLPEASEIIYLADGAAVAQGSFKTLLKKNQKFKELMDEHGIFANKKEKEEAKKQEEVKTIAAPKAGGQYGAETKERGSVAAKIYLYYAKVSSMSCPLRASISLFFRSSPLALASSC